MQKDSPDFTKLFESISHSTFTRDDRLTISEKPLTIPEIVAVATRNIPVEFNFSQETGDRFDIILAKLDEQIKSGIPIYGVSTAYGGQVSRVLTDGVEDQRIQNAQRLSEAIVHVDVSTGPQIPREIVKAAMLLRVKMLASGHSAVRVSTLEKLLALTNSNFVPVVGFYGTLGASGDLAHNGRVVSALRGLAGTKVIDEAGQVKEASEALEELAIEPLVLAPKEGLGLVNGDNFSTASAALVVFELTQLMLLNTFCAALTIQVLKGSTRSFHPLISNLRPHPGQQLTAKLLRQLLKDSQLAYQELDRPLPQEDGRAVQDPYSIRCLPQYFGPDWETLLQCWTTIETNANSVSDNPLWTSPDHVSETEEPYQWVSGGNFLAMHMSDALDKMRKVAIHIVKQNDRHLGRLINPLLSNGLPANLSDPSAISQCVFKGLQTQMGMYDVFATSLATPISTAFGIHEELNQDLTSHAMTSANLTLQVMSLTRYAIATNLIASCQAVDLRGGPDLLSPTTQPLYHWVRQQVPYIKEEQPLGHYIESLANNLSNEELLQLLLAQI